MRNYLTVFALSIFALSCGGCTTFGNLNSIHREFNLSDGKSQWVDAKQRAVFVGKDNIGISPTGEIVCAEPSPDALAAYAAYLDAQAKAPNGINIGVTGGTSEQAATIGIRTPSIQVLRDAYYRFCEAYANGGIKRWVYDVMLRRMTTNTLAYLAVEQLTDAAGAKNDATPITVTPPTPKPADGGNQNGNSQQGNSAKNAKKISRNEINGTNSNPEIIPADFVVAAAATATQNKSQTPAAHNSPGHNGQNQPTSPDGQNNQNGGDSQNAKPSDSLSAVADAVKAITMGTINEDNTLSICFTYIADGGDTSTDGHSPASGVPAQQNGKYPRTGNAATDFCNAVLNYNMEILENEKQCASLAFYKSNDAYCKSLASANPSSAQQNPPSAESMNYDAHVSIPNSRVILQSAPPKQNQSLQGLFHGGATGTNPTM
ncbi:MAG TPA: hypothetical protein VK779_06490 [Rhizomicrobium sp.]|jgi:hypothetical protein|nr:hypothetical protein [Rhizomicrobium sp.]